MSDERDVRSLASLEAGGLPLAAQERLDALRSRGGGLFTSDLSAAEAALLGGAGFRPVTQVMGSSVYHVGWQQMPYVSSFAYWDGGSTELDVLTEAWNEARSRALARLAEESRRAGADAVVGVRLKRRSASWMGDLVEFTAFGTAVRSTRYDLGEETVLSNLSGQDFAKLFAHGYWPAGLVAATSVTYIVGGSASRQARQGFLARTAQGGSLFSPNVELTDFTEGFYDARANALRRLERQAHAVHAHGTVGMQIDQSHTEREVDAGGPRTDLVVTVHVLGTAIVEIPSTDTPPTYIALGLEGEA